MILTLQKLPGRPVPGLLGLVLCSAILAMPRPALAAEAGQPQTQAASAPSPAGGEANGRLRFRCSWKMPSGPR